MEKQRIAVNDASVRMLQEVIRNTGGNVVLSPLSVLAVLQMAKYGAANETLKEFETVMGKEDLPLGVFSDFNKFGLSCRIEENPLHFANALWLNTLQDFRVKEEYLETCKKETAAEVKMCPFDAKALEEMNAWVAKNTDGMIQDAVSYIPKDILIFLMSAIAFRSAWKDKYNTERDIYDRMFSKENGEKQEVPFMHHIEPIYLKDEHAQGFLKYYSNKRYAFAALLPDDGMPLQEYINSLTGEKLSKILTSGKRAEVHTAIPKFSAEHTTDLKQVLKHIGLTVPFDKENADFSKIGEISKDNNIYIDGFQQKAIIKVDEKGTIAVAFTCMYKCLTACMPPKLETYKVYLNRPFLYMIWDCENQIPVFMGTVHNIE